MRTSISTLKALVNQINTLQGMPLEPYSRIDGKLQANIGNFHLSQAYGGVCVHRMANENGGSTTPIWGGYVPKREAENMIRAFLKGLEASH